MDSNFIKGFEKVAKFKIKMPKGPKPIKKPMTPKAPKTTFKGVEPGVQNK